MKLNLQRNANNWGYGQISAMILTFPSVAGVVQMFVNAREAEKYAKLNKVESGPKC